jgi:hypothetical protein
VILKPGTPRVKSSNSTRHIHYWCLFLTHVVQWRHPIKDEMHQPYSYRCILCP